MKKLVWIVLGVMALPFCVFAQKSPTDARVDAIWDQVGNRLSNQTDIWFDTGFFPACINLLRFMNSDDPADYEAATNLGWMLENVNEYDEALATYVRYRKDNPKGVDAPFPEANFYFQHKAYSKVPPLLEPTIDMKPHPNSYRLLAHSYEKLGLYPDALRVWKKLVADHPKEPGAQINLDKVQKKLATAPAAGH